MTSADLEHNEKQLANGKKLKWVTPKISLMEGEATAGKATPTAKELTPGSGPS
jgi:hypothetical protein